MNSQCFAGWILIVLAALGGYGCTKRQSEEAEPKPSAPMVQSRLQKMKPAVLCIGYKQNVNESGLPKTLAEVYGIQVGAVDIGQLNWETLSKFNAVVLFDMSRYNPGTRDANSLEISPQAFQQVSDLLVRFVKEGGGLYIYGISFGHMGSGWATESLNRFLKPLDAQVLFEELRDETREKRQPDGQQVLYALADRIEKHPATAEVKTYWYAVGPFSYGPWTRPLLLGAGWTPLIRTSDKFTSIPVDPDKGWNNYADGTTSAVKDKTAVIYAARELEKGRIILNGGESVISFFGYGYSPFADAQWGRVGMEKGLDGKPSDGLKLLAASILWLSEPSVKEGKLGGYVPPPKEPFKPREPNPLEWTKPGPIGSVKYYKGVIGAMSAGCGGSGTVADYVAAAEKLGLDYVVMTADFAKTEKNAWENLVADCKAATTADFMVMPAMLTMDDQGNRFIQCGATAWPKMERLSKKDPKRVQDHLGYWMNDCNFPFRAACWFSMGQYPPWLHSGLSAFAVRTYEDGRLVDEQVNGFMQNEEQGNRGQIITVNLLSSPAHMAEVKDFTFIQADNMVQLSDTWTRPQFQGGNSSFVSSGPQVRNWYLSNGFRDTGGIFYVPGTERWRASLKIDSEVPLKSVTFFDSTAVLRRMNLSGKTAEIHIDGLHDKRHVLTAVIEDERGARAMTGSLETGDSLMRQYFCSDRNNIMGGQSTIREIDGRETVVPASSMLYKAGRLYFGTVAKGENLPGIDGSGGATQLNIYPNFFMTAAEDKGEERAPIHQINRPYDSADLIVFDTPILKRSPAPDSEIYGHAPYVDLSEPKVAARLVQYHFYRKPIYPSPMMAEMSMTITDPAGVQLKKGWNDFSLRYAGAWGTIKKYAVVRTDGTREEGPSADEKTGTIWRGTLKPGDLVLFADVGEGFLLLDGELGVVIECSPSKKWFRCYLGRFDTPKLAANALLSVRLLNLKTQSTGDAAFGEFARFRDAFGIGNGEPLYKVEATQGKVTSSRYLLELAAENAGFAGTISQADLPQRLPIKVTGLNDKWTAAKVDLQQKEWFPLGVWNGAAYTTVDTREGAHDLYIGNLVTADNPDVMLTLVRDPENGKASVDVHNPTDKDIQTTVNVPTATFLGEKQTVKADVPKGSTVRLELK